MNEQSDNPKAVCISDIHFSVSTLDLASSALKQALEKSIELEVPLIIAGDLNDTKAMIRGEVANRLIEILGYSDNPYNVKILIGNHDLLNEKGDAHSLNFLAPYVEIINRPTFNQDLGLWLIPYQNSQEKLKMALAGCAKGSTIIMHQGVMGADMGHYIKDSTSLPREAFADFRVISGHYHKAQDIKCGRPRKGAVGLFSYIGSPYTISFSEANDGPKGFRILMSDGLLESVPTNLRSHRIVETTTELFPQADWTDFLDSSDKDLIWLKISGPKSELDKLDKKAIGAALFGHSNFKLDKIVTASEEAPAIQKEQKDTEMLDDVIDRTSEKAEQKATLKKLWRDLLNG